MLCHATERVDRPPRAPRAFRTLAAIAFGLGVIVSPGAWAQHRAHEHGVVKLDVAVQPPNIVLELSTPLDSLIGFERTPRTAEERRRADEAVAKLRDAGRLFVIDAAAQCKPSGVTLVSQALRLGTQAPAEHDGHADLDASFTFECRDAARAGFIEVKLFAAFGRMQRIDVQAITPGDQLKSTLKRPQSRLPLTRRAL